MSSFLLDIISKSGIPSLRVTLLTFWGTSKQFYKVAAKCCYASCTCVLSCFSRAQLFATLRTATLNLLAPLSMEFSGQEYWNGLNFLLQRIFPTQESNLSLMSSALAGGFFTASATWEGHYASYSPLKYLASELLSEIF